MTLVNQVETASYVSDSGLRGTNTSMCSVMCEWTWCIGQGSIEG